MDSRLFAKALTRFFAGLIIVAALIFLPAGTFSYPQGWLLMAILFIPMLGIGIFLLIRNPQLLRKRLNDKETQSEQKKVVLLSMVMFLAVFILAGFNVRFGWYILPMWVSWTAAVIFLAAYLMYAEVVRENEYLSRVVEVQEHQKVIDTGLYGIVRHPMYASTVILFLMMPLVLGSIASFIAALMYLPIIDRRMRNEEEVLEQGLEGYPEYKKKVRYKVIPYIW